MSIALLLCLLGSSPELDQGRLAFGAMRYQQAVDELRRVADDEAAAAVERTEALELIARSQLALGRPDDARLAWDALLALNPMSPEPSGAPKVRSSFRQAKAARFPPRYLALLRRPSSDDVLELGLVNPWGLPVEVELWEASGAGDFERRALVVSDHRVLAPLKAGSRFYVRAVAPDGVALSTLGGPAAPLAGPPLLLSDRPVAGQLTPPPSPPADTSALDEQGAARRASVIVRRWAGGSLAVAGLAGAVVGVVFFALGVDGLVRSEQWPENGLSLTDSELLGQTGQGRALGGGIGGALGLASLVTGLVLLLGADPAPASAPASVAETSR